VAEASQGDPLESGKILIAPETFIWWRRARRSAACVWTSRPQQNSCRPAVDALFASIGEVYGGAAIAVILTGMGQDGLRVRNAQGAGGTVLAQDEATSVVWGMPARW